MYILIYFIYWSIVLSNGLFDFVFTQVTVRSSATPRAWCKGIRKRRAVQQASEHRMNWSPEVVGLTNIEKKYGIYKWMVGDIETKWHISGGL